LIYLNYNHFFFQFSSHQAANNTHLGKAGMFTSHQYKKNIMTGIEFTWYTIL